MGRILNIFKKLLKRRRHDRYHVPDRFLVVVSPAEKMVQAIDISMGGMAFIYEGDRNELKLSSILTMTLPTKKTKKVGFDTISDIPAPGGTRSSGKSFRRRGVKFDWLGVLDKEGLMTFIKDVGTVAV